MKVVYNLIKYPLIYSFIGLCILEIITIVVFFIVFNISLIKNESRIRITLVNQTEEFLNSINYLIKTKLNSVEKDLLLFNQHMHINYIYNLDKDKINYDNCILEDSKDAPLTDILAKYDSVYRIPKDRSEKLTDLLKDEYLQKISFYTPENPSEYKYDFYGDKIKLNICYAVSYLRASFVKNVINRQHQEKLNYTLYLDDVIFFYPSQRINDNSLKNLPFYNPSVRCRDQRYKFECSSILKYKPTDEGLTLYNTFIYMEPKIQSKNLYINLCLSINDKENEKINIDPYLLGPNPDTDPPNYFFCITLNLTNVFEIISRVSNSYAFNIVQYDEESDSLKIFFSTNEDLYNDISLNKDKNSNLFTSDEYGKYKINDNKEENIADFFHLLYYEIEKYNHKDKDIKKYIKEYESNIKEIKELISSKSSKALNVYASQSFINYNYDNNGNVNYNKSNIDTNEYIYFFRPITSDMIKVNEKKNLMEKDENHKKTIFYTITVLKISKPKNTSFIYLIYIFICSKLCLYSCAIEFFICIIFYIILFYLIRCILNPFNTFKTSIEELLDNTNKKKAEEEKKIAKKKSLSEKKNSLKNMGGYYEGDEGGLEKKSSMDERKNSEKNKNEEINNSTNNENINNFIKITSELTKEYTNYEMKEIEDIICFLQKVLLLRDENTPYQAKADFYQSISSEISKKYQLDLFKCQILIGEYYIKDRKYLKAKNELENLQIRIELSKNELLSKDKFNERKNGLLSTYYGTYINDYTTKKNIKEDKFITLEMISESLHYLIGLSNYFLFLELKHGKKKFMNQYKKQKTLNLNKQQSSINKDNKSSNNINLNVNNNNFDINSGTNNITSQMDYYLEKAIKHFKESYKINNSMQINQIKNIIILVYLSKCYLEFSNKSIEDANKALKKAFLAISNFNELIIELTDEENFSLKKKRANKGNDFLMNKNMGTFIDHKLKDCYVDSRVMLIVNGSLIQFILYQIGKMALKLHKPKVAYYCFVKLISISFFKNENLHFKAIKWIRYLLNQFMEKKKNNNIGNYKALIVKFKLKRTNSNMSINLGNEDEILINKSSIDFMKKYLKNLVELFEKNKYKRREKKVIIELLTMLDKKIVYKPKILDDVSHKKKPNFKNFAQNFFSRLVQTPSLSSSNKELNNLNSSGQETIKSKEINLNEDNCITSKTCLNDYNGTSPLNANEKTDSKIQKVISKAEYEAITKSFISRDLLIGQIINSPLKISEDEKTIKYIDKQYFRLNPKGTINKCLIIILSESFLQNFSSLKSFNLFIQDCIMKFMEDNDKIGYILYSFSSGFLDKTFELEYKSVALKKLDELFQSASSVLKSKKPINKNKMLTDSFDTAMEMFNNEQLNNNTDINTKTDKYIFCFGTLNNLRYKCYEASFAQKNRMNYMEISLYYFVFDSIDFYRDKIPHYKKYFKKFIEGFLVFVENFKLIKLCFANICKKGKQKNLFSNKLECVQNIIS